MMMQAIDYDCIGQPDCIGGYSNMLTLTVPKPPQTYRGSVEVPHHVHIVYLTLRVTPLGESLPYTRKRASSSVWAEGKRQRVLERECAPLRADRCVGVLAQPRP